MACKCHFQPPFMHFKLFKSSTQKNKMKEANAVAYLLLLHCSCPYGTFPKKNKLDFHRFTLYRKPGIGSSRKQLET